MSFQTKPNPHANSVAYRFLHVSFVTCPEMNVPFNILACSQKHPNPRADTAMPTITSYSDTR